MVSFAGARLIVAQTIGPTWAVDFPGSTFFVAPWGYADDRDWQVVYGAREHLVEGDGGSWSDTGEPLALVNRETGELTFSTFLLDPRRFSAMVRVGHGHPPGWA